VLVDHCTLGDVGEDRWLVYDNLGDGFAATSTDFVLPGAVYAGGDTFDQIAADQECTFFVAQPAYRLFDIDGDLSADLVIFDQCDPGGDGPVGEDYWEVHFNVGGGFATITTEWSLPGALYDGPETFDLLDGVLECDAGSGVARPSYGLADADGDERLDLVVLDVCTTGGNGLVGEEFWLIHTNTGTGFADATSEFELPGTQFPGAETFDSFASEEDCSTGTPAYDTLDLDGDGGFDLVITDVCTDDVTGEEVWGLYEQVCVP
jgi:hypothetical protein